MITVKAKKNNVFPQIVRLFFMVVLGLIFLFPFFVMILQGFMTWEEVSDIPVKIFPSKINFDNYKAVMNPEFFTYFGNTLFVIGMNVIFVPLSGYLVAYGFSKIRFAGSSFFFSIGMATIMIPSIACTVPLYVLYSKLGWLNTLLPFVIPQMFGGGMMNIFLMMQFLKGVPNTYVEAAKLDGASELKTAIKIVAPLCIPVITLIMVNTFIGVWNDFTGPLTYISEDCSEKFTMAVAMYRRYANKVYADEKRPNEQAALCMILMIPTLVLFGFFQKSLINGVSLSGLK